MGQLVSDADTHTQEYLTEWSVEHDIGWRHRYATVSMTLGAPGRFVGKAHYLKFNGVALCGKNPNRSFLTVLVGDHCQSCEHALSKRDAE